jgi:hypothetical protein
MKHGRGARAAYACKGIAKSTVKNARSVARGPRSVEWGMGGGCLSGTHEIRNLFVETAHSCTILEFLINPRG